MKQIQDQIKWLNQQLSNTNERIDSLLSILVKNGLCKSKEQTKKEERELKNKNKKQFSSQFIDSFEVQLQNIDKVVINFDCMFIRFIDTEKRKSETYELKEKPKHESKKEEGIQIIYIEKTDQGKYIHQDNSTCLLLE